jgi:hypothetical protein
MTDEAALLERARSYDEEAIGELYDMYARRIFKGLTIEYGMRLRWCRRMM